MKLIIIQPNGSRVEREIITPPSLETLQEGVGGLIELVPLFQTIWSDGRRRPCTVYCNEEGKLRGLEYNPTATELWHSSIQENWGRTDGATDVLVGPVVIVVGESF